MTRGNFQPDPPAGFENPHVRPLDRVLLTRLRPVPQFINGALLVVPLLTAFALFDMARHTARLWLLAPALLLGVAGWMLSSQYEERALSGQMQRDDARTDELLAGSGTRTPLRCATAFGWPIALTLLCALFSGLAVLAKFEPRAVFMAAALAIAGTGAWIIAVRRARCASTLSVKGIEIGATLIPWNGIASLSARGIGRSGSAYMTVSLFDRELARKLGACAGVSATGSSGTELLLSLDGSVETVAVKYQFAQTLCSRVRQENAREAARRDVEQVRAHSAAHPELAVEIERRQRAGIEQELARARASLEVLKGRQDGLSLPSYRIPGVAKTMPAISQWLLVGSIALVAAISIYGFRASMLPSPEWQDLSPFVVLGIGAALSAWVLKVLLPRAERDKRTTLALGMPMMILGMCWPITMYALPDIFTRVAGRNFTLVGEMRREYSPSDRTCKHRIHGELFDSAGLARHYCADVSEFNRLPDQGSMQAIGRRSWFGIHVDLVIPAKGDSHLSAPPDSGSL